MTIFNAEEVPEHGIGTVLRRLERICRILSQLVGQISILETMTPLDFLDFRDYLFPASGFQSVQFRILENKLGLRRQDRLKYARSDYCGALNEEHKHVVEDVEKAPSMFELVERWLERTPFLESEDFDFWSEYKVRGLSFSFFFFLSFFLSPSLPPSLSLSLSLPLSLLKYI